MKKTASITSQVVNNNSFKQLVKNNWQKDEMNDFKDFYNSEKADFHKDLLYKMKEGTTVEGIQTKERVETLISLIDSFENKVVLDIGTGVGLYASEAAIKGCNVIGMDFSHTMLSEAKDIASEQHIKYTGLVQSAAPFFPFKESSIDIIIIGDVIEHLLPKVLSDMLIKCSYILKPKGKMVVHTAPSKYYSLFLGNRKFLFLALPMLFMPLPAFIIEIWFNILYYSILLYKRIFKSISDSDDFLYDKHGHINCQTLHSISAHLEKAGFIIKKSFTKEIFLRNKNLFSKLPFKLIPNFNRHFLHRSIFAVGITKEVTL